FSKNITGLWVEQEARRQWKREGEDIGFGELSEMAANAAPLRSFIDPDDPMFAPPGDMPRRIADYCMKTGQPVPETKGEIVRVILESLAMKYRATVDMIDELCGKRIPAINIVGGGTQEKQLSQFTANACGRPVYTGPIEATALGNIVSQAIAAGEIKDIREGREVVSNSCEFLTFEPKDTEKWNEAYERFKKVTKC
ncbi:MAG: rhamnulokinase, partial [Clostridiales bacterium]|nr:rhamnulokinase [Clostridiales bacterium]